MSGRAHKVLLVHGIRTQGEWQQQVRRALEREAGIEVIPTRYEFLDVVRFLIPWRSLRERPIRRIEGLIRDALDEEPRPRLSIVAHSFGTYIVGALLLEKTDLRVHRLVLCGSILRDDYPWHRMAKDRLGAVVNECGWRDIWPIMAKSATWGFGSSGAFGFGSTRVVDRFHELPHGGFLGEEFAETYWCPFISNGEIIEGRVDRPTTSWLLSLVTVVHLKYLLLLALLVVAATALPPSWWRREQPIPQPQPSATRTAAALEGTVLTHDGRAVVGATVIVEGIPKLQTDEYGRFQEITTLRPGQQVKVQVFDGDQRVYHDLHVIGQPITVRLKER